MICFVYLLTGQNDDLRLHVLKVFSSKQDADEFVIDGEAKLEQMKINSFGDHSFFDNMKNEYDFLTFYGYEVIFPGATLIVKSN